MFSREKTLICFFIYWLP